ncbi:hypothetical protein CVT24_009714 [Panaeolus cyanescens]|uniref:DUF7082 domain-containing protein n=1 Tax=Panaeolus cyanescens TaxID=181874 RepID=A0A409Y9W9_9AGAR|nr:hypothetical protein CVT24_009714 [Panaeolus cyanescens]
MLESPIISPAGFIHVLAYSPEEGEPGVPISVRIHFHPDQSDPTFVRLVIGNKAVPTKVRQLPGITYGSWQLNAAAPPFDRLQFDNTKVLISVQALNKDDAVLDSVTFGHFSYWAADRRSLPRLSISHPRKSSISSLPDHSTAVANRKTRLHRRMKPQSLMRTKQNTDQGDNEELYAQTPILDLVTPLSSICLNWSQSELNAGRRLVRFSKVQDGRRLIVSCEPIAQEDYCESDSVISCIYRHDTDTCFVTSVDVIYLLERLTNGEFPVEEKNRIRRNLEGLRPTTISKHKPGFGDFFQRIMEFPDPKPRNIEKDLKVFDWNLLGQALEKILSKYSIYTSPTPDNESSASSSAEASPAAESPELYAMQLSYPPPDDSSSRFLDQQQHAHKSEYITIPVPPHTADEQDLFVSPVESTMTTSSSSSASSVFPLFAADPSDQSGNQPWTTGANSTDFKSAAELGLGNYNLMVPYDAVDTLGHASGVHAFTDNPPLDFTIYDNFGFHPGISDDTITNLADSYI